MRRVFVWLAAAIAVVAILVVAAASPHALPKLHSGAALRGKTGIGDVFQYSIAVRDMVIAVDESFADGIEQEGRDP